MLSNRQAIGLFYSIPNCVMFAIQTLSKYY